MADLRGYGDSGKPALDAAGLVYAERSMAADQAGLMRRLGFEQFQLVGHDRGARVVHRLTLDQPGAVTEARRAGHRADPACPAQPADGGVAPPPAMEEQHGKCWTRRSRQFSACGAQALIACQIPPDSGVFDTQ
jgi:pimeloyl-ACP methyl ester carboxylesterase